MNLTKLPTFKDREKRIVRCVVETPAGSACKLDYDSETKAFELAHDLIKGLTYPYDFGFLPSTLGEDGDPLDVMLIHEVSTVPGLLVPAKLIGVLEIIQREDGKSLRNDRVFAVPIKSHREDDIREVDDLSKRTRRELEKFFIATDELENKELEILGWKGPKAADKLVQEAMDRFDSDRK